ncbi:hypothetical protein A5784_17265 [Mycobacterium sp. 852013-50091_SCH5140682]|uniref:hypothetical protein n=1 Tax=Mycobacterium sp. 852013-50091_SCH5140682 TaxID=1834109 RepID=UPI0007EB9B2F|nr:hypothetical protein [Mycobacterium sp. 852013-50091_SCH5140682]OBC01845.1 hypothetical protein A5784_17265 [Mycobacterium sp. 852013-50091_SCH5140682]
MNTISDADRRKIEIALGRPLDSFAVIDDLHGDVRQALSAARSLPAELVQPFLSAITAPTQQRAIPRFIEAVVEGDQDAATWDRSGVVLLRISVADLVQAPVAVLLDRLPVESGEWVRMPLDRLSWARGDDTVGAPAVWCDDLDHTEPSRPGQATVIMARERVTRITDPVLTARRWIAARLAYTASRGYDVDTLPSLSEDAAIAVHALNRERTFDAAAGVPGFRGPDYWFSPDDLAMNSHVTPPTE